MTAVRAGGGRRSVSASLRVRWAGVTHDASQVRAVGTAFLRQRPVVTVPPMIVVLGLFLDGGAPRGQVAAMAAGFTVLQGMFIAERWIGARRMLSSRALARSLTVTAIGLAAGCLVSGAMASPLVPMLLAPTGIGFAAFGRGKVSGWLLAILLVTVAALALVPRGEPFPVLRSPHRELGTAVALAACAVLLRLGVAALADAHAAAGAALGRAGDDAAWAARVRAQELDSLGQRVAHEVKNPLAAIRGLVEVMLEARRAADAPAADPDLRRLTVVAGEVERIERVLRDYLAHQRPLAELELSDVDLRELARDVAAVLEVRAARSGVTLAVDGGPVPARVDARRLKEAVLNLALNALDAAGADGKVELRASAPAGGPVLEVRDDGRGMTPDELARLGTPGFTTRADGTGLGVALARAVVEQHRGSLGFTSAPGRGTIATIRLPPAPGPT